MARIKGKTFQLKFFLWFTHSPLAVLFIFQCYLILKIQFPHSLFKRSRKVLFKMLLWNHVTYTCPNNKWKHLNWGKWQWEFLRKCTTKVFVNAPFMLCTVIWKHICFCKRLCIATFQSLCVFSFISPYAACFSDLIRRARYRFQHDLNVM